MIIDCHVNIWESKDATNEYNKQFSRIKPGNYSPPTPNIETIFKAMKQVCETGKGPKEQIPSLGCSIKWLNK